MPNRSRAFLQYASSETDADILYGSGFLAYDPFIYIEHRDRSYLVVTDFERDRARSESPASQVWAATALAVEDAARLGAREPDMTPAGLVAAALRRIRVQNVVVPPQFQVGLARKLEKAGIGIRVGSQLAYPERLIKTPEEIRAITSVQRAVERSMAAAATVLRRSRVLKNRLVLGGKTLRAEDLHRVINQTLMEHSCVASQTIVAPGDQAVDPHNLGSGPIRPDQPIVIDIFPRSMKSQYFADMTRTLIKGRARPELVSQYRAVLRAQKLALSLIRPGVTVISVHQAVQRCFEELGFRTGQLNGRLQGYTHSTGHGVGLEIHEPPKIGLVSPSVRFKKGMVVTVEPGLYYLGTGGVRIEDLVVVTGTGIRNLTRYSKRLGL